MFTIETRIPRPAVIEHLSISGSLNVYKKKQNNKGKSSDKTQFVV